MQAFTALLVRDLRLALRQGADVVMVLAFFVIAASLFPLGVGPGPQTLKVIAPGVIWVLALLSVMLSLERMYEADHADGTLEQITLQPQPLSLMVLAKALAHWLTTGVPLIALAPVIGAMLALDPAANLPLLAGLALGTPILSLIGSIGAALALGARRGGVLVALMVLPLYIPVLIFGVTAVDASVSGLGAGTHYLILAAMLTAAIPLSPLAAAAAIKHAVE